MSTPVDVIEEADRAVAMLQPGRRELLALCAEPQSATALAERTGAPRQRINYHLQQLEKRGLLQVVSERRRGSVVERIYRRSGERYALSAQALGPLGATPEAVGDRFSSAFQIAVASRAVGELGALQRGAETAGKRLATLTLDSEVRFATPLARHAFATELSEAVAALVAKYHDGTTAEGRSFRLYVGSYPKPRAAD